MNESPRSHEVAGYSLCRDLSAILTSIRLERRSGFASVIADDSLSCSQNEENKSLCERSESHKADSRNNGLGGMDD